MPVCLGIDQLSVDPELIARPPDAPFKHVSDPQVAVDLLGIGRLCPVGERGIARDHEHVRESREVGRQILGDPVREILLLWIVAQIGERQYHYRQARWRIYAARWK